MAYTNLGDFLTACANAIRGVEGSSATIIANDMPDRISALGSGIPSGLPSDGKTRIGYKIPSLVGTQGYKINLVFYQSTSSTSTTVDWGDSSSATTTTGSGRKTLTHTYSAGGDYIVTITINAGTIYFGGGSSYTIYGDYATTAAVKYMKKYIQWVVLGTGVSKLANYSFYGCYCLQEVRFPSSGFTTIGDYDFDYCYSLQRIELPTSDSSISQYSLANCVSLNYLSIPSAVTTIAGNGLANLNTLNKLRFNSNTPPTASASTAFSNLPTTCKISVPTGKLSAYTSAANYPSSSTYTYIEED